MAHSDKKALIVQGNEPFRNLLKGEMIRFGYEVTICTDASSGWGYFEKELPPLVVLDGEHQGVNGLELCNRIRRHPSGRYVTIILTTSKGEPEDQEKAIRSGASYCVAKAVNPGSCRGWILWADRNVGEAAQLRADHERAEACRKELEFTERQLEEVITRTTQLAVEAEISYLELNQIFKTAASGIWVISKDHQVLRFNDAFLKIAHISEKTIAGKKCHEIFRNPLCNTGNCPLKRIMAGQGRVELEVGRQLADGSTVYHMLISTPLRAPGAELVAIVTNVVDITDRVKAQKALRESEKRYMELSIIDDLSRLYNKRHLNDRLGREMEGARRYGYPLSLLLLDIDDFKDYNDTYGHMKGDRVLARMGEVIAGNIRQADSAYRYGGEEFVVIMPQTPGESAAVLAERLRERFASEAFIPDPGKEVCKTVSIGVTQYIPPENQRTFLARADQNMYEAKAEGKNLIYYR